jgi:hypothetical protein
VIGTVEGPLLSCWPEKRFERSEILGLGCAVELDDEFDDEPRSTRYLIERQRKLGESPRPLDHLYAVAVGGALSDRLNELSDRQIGQLLFDFCWAECYFNSPELIICTHAIDRLRRSTGGAVTNEEAQDSLKQQPARNVETRCFYTTELTNLISGCVTAWPAGTRDTSADQ